MEDNYYYYLRDDLYSDFEQTIAVDSDGNIIVGGNIFSDDFPV